MGRQVYPGPGRRHQIRRRTGENLPSLPIAGTRSDHIGNFQFTNFMDDKIKEAIFKQIEREPFAQKFGFRLLDLDAGHSKVEMNFTPDMENMFGSAHGGALFALIDEAFETASNSHGTMAVALNMNVVYLSSPVSGSRLIAEAHELNRTEKTAAYDIKVVDDRNRLIASCQALVYRKGKPLPFLPTEEDPSRRTGRG